MTLVTLTPISVFSPTRAGPRREKQDTAGRIRRRSLGIPLLWPSPIRLELQALKLRECRAHGLDFLVSGLLIPLHLFQRVSHLVQTFDGFTIRAFHGFDLRECFIERGRFAAAVGGAWLSSR